MTLLASPQPSLPGGHAVVFQGARQAEVLLDTCVISRDLFIARERRSIARTRCARV
jgi:hypothetical protein